MAVPEGYYDKLKPHLGPDKKAAILIHPDPDSLASAWALVHLFKKNKSAADVVIHESIKRLENRSMVKLLRIPTVQYKEGMFSGYNCLCLVDGQANQFPEVSVPRWDFVIDHHPISPGFEYGYADIRPDMGATSTMMTGYLERAKIRIGAGMATALCYGIITDTDHFQRHVTKADALAFSKLFPKVNYRVLRLIEQAEIPYKQLQYLDFALHRLEVVSRRAVIHVGAPDSPDIAVILADFFVRVSGIQFVAISCFSMEKLVIIFRSRSMRRDAGKIANIHFSEYGSAGGHKSAARAEIPLGRLPADVRIYDADSVEKFVLKCLSKPGKPSSPKEEGKAAGE